MTKAIKYPFCKQIFIDADFKACPFCKKPLYNNNIFSDVDNPLKDIFDGFGGHINEEN